MRERGAVDAAVCSGVRGEKAQALAKVMNSETLHRAVIFRSVTADTCRRGARKSAQW
jgi:hypothetical protein